MATTKHKITLALILFLVTVIAMPALAQDTLTVTDLGQAQKLIEQHGWVALCALALHVVLRLMHEGSKPDWFTVPTKWRPLLVLLLGQAAAVLDLIVQGTAWRPAVVGGFVAAAVAMLTTPSVLPGAAPQPALPAQPEEQLNPSTAAQPSQER